MKALVFHKPKDIRYETVPDPKIEHVRDAIVRVTSTSICGSDLHIFNGYFPQRRPMVLGHEFMGVVEEVGPRVANLKKGDRVVVPFPIACGQCFFCKRGLAGHCEQSNPEHYGPDGGPTQTGGGLFGYTDIYGPYNGGQAEYVRVPYADVGPRIVPDTLSDEKALFLSDIIPTGWAAAKWSELKGGETVAVFGCGPVGLMAQRSAFLQGAKRVIAVDLLGYRLNMARRAGCETVDAAIADPVEEIRRATQGHGADACIDAVGMEEHHSFGENLMSALLVHVGTVKVLRQAMRAVRRGGRVSVIGVYGADADFPLGQMFDKGLSIRGGQAPVHAYIDELLKFVMQEKIAADDLVTHRLPLEDGPRAYEMFNNKEDNCIKVILKPGS